MNIIRDFRVFNDRLLTVIYNEPNECPLCKHALKPEELYIDTYKNSSNDYFLSALYLCHNCYNTFTALYSCNPIYYLDPNLADLYEEVEVTTELLYISPQKYKEEHFEPLVEKLSPQFVKIYNQALSAETAGLDEIAGVGYRKAIEFLVKDFCIHQCPERADSIKRATLGYCISYYIKHPRIATLASRIAWIGNDETHYIRKQTERDISDMKAFIKALVYFIGMILIAEDAETIAPIKPNHQEN